MGVSESDAVASESVKEPVEGLRCTGAGLEEEEAGRVAESIAWTVTIVHGCRQ